MKKLQRQAFTLVELIVVITILAILGTIAFISFQNYSKNARDWVRVADINNIEKSLGIFITEKWFYPIPDYGTHITYSWALVRTQWTAWDNVTTNLRNLSKKPVDPLTWNEYTYSVANNNVEYQVATILEWWSMVYNLPVTNQANAAMTKKATAKVKWTYNEKILKVSTGWLNYILAVPSIINSNIGRADLQDLINNKELVFNNYENLPDSYKNLWYTMTWWFDYNPSGIVVYTGSMTELCSSWTVQQQFVKNLQTVYQNTIISSESEIKEIIFAITPAQQQLLAWNYIDNHIWWITWTNTVVTVVETDTQQQGTFVSNCTANWQIIYTDWNWVEIWKVSKTWVTISWNPWSLTCDWHIIVCNDNNAWYILQACNVWATWVWWYTETNWLTSHESFWNYYQFGKSNTWWTSWIWYNDGDWKSPGWTNAWSANDWWVLDANKDISTWLNSDTMSRIKMQWPCPINYHIPTKAEWVVIYTIWWWYNWSWIPVSNALKLPVAGARWYNGNFQLQGSDGNYWSSSPLTTAWHYLYFRNDAVSPSSNATRNLGLSVRCMKNINWWWENIF